MIIHPADKKHREDFMNYAKMHGQEWYKEYMVRLYDDWDKWNSKYFYDKLVPPYILLTDMQGVRVMGDCSEYSAFGGKSQIRLRKAILTGDFGIMKKGSRDKEGCYRILGDTLLHEMIHQYMQEVEENPENKFKGHGPIFRDHCNRIGEDLGFLEVRTAKQNSKDEKEKPLCAYWPHRENAEEYYMGAFPARLTFGERKKKVRELSEIEQTAQENLVEDEDGIETIEGQEDGHIEAAYPEVVEQDRLEELLSEGRDNLSPTSYQTLIWLIHETKK